MIKNKIDFGKGEKDSKKFYPICISLSSVIPIFIFPWKWEKAKRRIRSINPGDLR